LLWEEFAGALPLLLTCGECKRRNIKPATISIATTKAGQFAPLSLDILSKRFEVLGCGRGFIPVVIAGRPPKSEQIDTVDFDRFPFQQLSSSSATKVSKSTMLIRP
jgi:hypothetical protein